MWAKKQWQWWENNNDKTDKLTITGKKGVFLRFLKVAGKIFITTVSKKNFQKKSDDDNGGFQQQVPQRFVDRYGHMNIQNKR